MAGETGRKTTAVKQLLGEDPSRFSLFQLLRLLERDLGDSFDQVVRLRPYLGLEHQDADIVDVQAEDDQSLELVTGLEGLYGVASPLPVFYTEDLIDAEQEDRRAARQLLDIFHRRLYLLTYRSLSKYRPLFSTVEQGETQFRKVLDSFLGLRDEAIRAKVPDPSRLIRYIGLFAQQPRSAVGLRTLLEDAFPEISVEIVQCDTREVKIPDAQRLSLGRQGSSLGVDTTIGSTIEDSSGRIVVRLGPLSAEQFHQITQGEQWRMLVFLIKQYLNTALECEIEWFLEQGASVPVQPGGDHWAMLGQDTWLGSEQTTSVTGRTRLQ